MRKLTLSVATFCLCCISICGQTTQYKGLFADDPEGINGINNPERGFRLEVAMNVSNGASMWNSSDFPDVTTYLEQQMEEYKEEKIALVQTYFYLTDAIGREITEDEFNRMESFFDTLRKKGLKAILRFAYETDNVAVKNGPTQQDIITHTQQLKKILRENQDVILVVQAGFIGAWGEWHSSFHGLEKSKETMKTILKQICGMTPGDRMVQVRMPYIKNVLESSSAYLDRVSYHDDFIVIKKHPWSKGMERGGDAYKQITEESPYSIIDGELPWGKWSTEKDSNNNVNTGWIIDGLETARRLYEHHYTSLSAIHNYKEHGAKKKYSMMYWKETPITEKFLKEHMMPYAPNYFRKMDGSKAERTVFDYIRDHLGYRLELQKFKTKKQWNTGKANRIELSLINRGFSTLFNDHPIYFVLIDASGHIAYRIRTQDDTWLWQPYRPNDKLKLPITHTIKADIIMERGSVEKGTYKIGLWIPDGAEHLMFDYRYAIRCANNDVEWWVSPDKKYGVNILTTIRF
ncbi:MAG: DUF4832 domain-containing protein [Tannerellaceae bacterium]|jgi:hypothetical protein|nr:DUF4832 domain-containing protein [Tannerellaceae bacterium]